MKRIKFRHNKYSPGVLYILVIFGVAAGLLVFFGFLTISGIDKGPEYGPIYFREYPIHAVYLIFALIPIFMLFPTWIAKKIWSHEDQEAYIDLYEDYAELTWNDRKVHIKKGELDIKIPKPQPFWYGTYILKIPQCRIVLVSSVKENKENNRVRRSLDIAIKELSIYKKSRK